MARSLLSNLIITTLTFTSLINAQFDTSSDPSDPGCGILNSWQPSLVNATGCCGQTAFLPGATTQTEILRCENGRVSEVLFADMRLIGILPPALAQLTELKVLFLNYNHFSGNIPPELGQLTKLRQIWLVDNQMSGSLPPELGLLTQLEELGLQHNKLAGFIPAELGQLTNLKQLILQGNQFSGPIPDLSSLQNLQSCRFNGIPDLICEAFTQIPNVCDVDEGLKGCPSSQSNAETDEGFGPAKIAGIVVALAVVLLAIGLILLFRKKKSKRAFKKRQAQDTTADSIINRYMGSVSSPDRNMLGKPQRAPRKHSTRSETSYNQTFIEHASIGSSIGEDLDEPSYRHVLPTGFSRTDSGLYNTVDRGSVSGSLQEGAMVSIPQPTYKARTSSNNSYTRNSIDPDNGGSVSSNPKGSSFVFPARFSPTEVSIVEESGSNTAGRSAQDDDDGSDHDVIDMGIVDEVVRDTTRKPSYDIPFNSASEEQDQKVFGGDVMPSASSDPTPPQYHVLEQIANFCASCGNEFAGEVQRYCFVCGERRYTRTQSLNF